MQDQLLQAFLTTAIEVLVPIALAALIPWVVQQLRLLKSQISGEKFKFAVETVSMFVSAAEQNGLIGALSDIGAEKKQWVLEQVQAELSKHGVKIDVAVISNIIEAEVYKQFSAHKDEFIGLLETEE